MFQGAIRTFYSRTDSAAPTFGAKASRREQQQQKKLDRSDPSCNDWISTNARNIWFSVAAADVAVVVDVAAADVAVVVAVAAADVVAVAAADVVAVAFEHAHKVTS